MVRAYIASQDYLALHALCSRNCKNNADKEALALLGMMNADSCIVCGTDPNLFVVACQPVNLEGTYLVHVVVDATIRGKVAVAEATKIMEYLKRESDMQEGLFFAGKHDKTIAMFAFLCGAKRLTKTINGTIIFNWDVR